MTQTKQRFVPVDLAKSAAIFGTLLIHTSAAGGFSGAVGSFSWISALFWGSVLRCAVPVFFLCSGALLLPPEKPVSVGKVWKKYILRILVALLFWAAAYRGAELIHAWRASGVLEAAALRQAAVDLLTFHHKSHLYYLHVILLVYAVLPLTRLFVEKADRALLRYALAVWFVLGILAPTFKDFGPFALVQGIPRQYPLNLTWAAVGYGVLGHTLTVYGRERRPRDYGLLYLAGFALTFGGTLGISLAQGTFYQGLLQGTAPGVCMEAVGLYGLCLTAGDRRRECRPARILSDASFCVYLVHLFFLDFLTARGFSAAVLPPIWAAPALAAVIFVLSFAVWLILRRIPVVNRWLI